MASPLSALTDTWNNVATVFTAIKMTVTDTASAATSRLFALLVGSTDKFVVEKDGGVFSAGMQTVAPNGVVGTRSVDTRNITQGNYPTATPALGLAAVSGGNTEIAQVIGIAEVVQDPGRYIPVMSEVAISDIITNDIGLYAPNAANIGFDFHIAQANPPAFDPYPGDMGSINWDDGQGTDQNLTYIPTGNVVEVGLHFNPSSATSSGNDASSVLKFGVRVVAGLPAAATVGAGARALVTDATASTFASTVVGGGSTKVPVYSDGANWKIG